MDNNFNLFNLFLTNVNSSVEFAICLRIMYHMKTSLLICSTNPWMVRDFSGGYSLTECNFNCNINVNATDNRYMNSSLNFSFSQVLKDLLVLRIMKLEGTSKITTQFRTIL